jgi:glycosyltransferase involved in cell wall biosynthesis
MKIVTAVDRTAPTGGIEIQSLQVARELARRGNRLDLLYVEPGPFVADYRRFCRSVTKVPRVDYWFAAGRRTRLRDGVELVPAVAAAARRRPDVLYGNRVFSTGWSVPAGRLVRAPVVCHLHGHSDLSPRRIDYLNRYVDRFVVISRFIADKWLASGLDPAKVGVVHNGIDPAAYPEGGPAERASARRELGLDDEVFVAACVGRIDREKGIDVALEAWRRLGLAPEFARLLVVGSPTVVDDADAYRAELAELAGPGVTFLPGRADVVGPLHAADVVLVPSVWDEPFGRAVIEGLSTGRPVLASRVGGIPEVLEGPMARFLFERGDAESLAAHVSDLRGWREREPELADTCRSWVQRHFTLSAMVDGVESAFAAVRRTAVR